MFKPVTITALALIAAFASTAAAPADQPPYKVGIVYSFTGNGGNAETLFDTAVATYVKEHGDTVNGRKIVLIKRDDTGVAPDVARRMAQELVVQEQVDMLGGLIFTPNAIAVGGVSTQTKTPLIIVNAATSGILAKNPYSFRFGITTAQITTPLATYAAKTGGAKNVFVIVQDFGPGIDAANSFEKAFTDAGGTIAGEARVPMSTTEFSAYLQRARDSKADSFYVFLSANGAAPAFLHTYRAMGFDAKTHLFATGDLADDTRLKQTGDEALGIISASNYYVDLDNPANKKFVADYHEVGPTAGNPDFVAVSAYDMMNAIYTIVQKNAAGLDKTVDLLSHIKFASPRGPFEIDPQTRDAVQNVYILQTVKRNGVVQNVPLATSPMVKDPLEK
jgi:branched-chain amino acid transport system substrate-binding protein